MDYIIVGQGLAGTVLDIHLQNVGLQGIIIDPGSKNASKAAAGIINPLTGRRFDKSWMFDSLWTYLQPFYAALNKEYGSVYNSMPITRTVDYRYINALDEKRLAEPYERYFLDYETSVSCKNEYSFVSVKGARLDMKRLLALHRFKLLERRRIISESFIHEDLNHNGIWRYHGLQAENIIFAEGHKVKSNPYFSEVLNKRNTGYALTFNIPKGEIPHIARTKYFLVPISDSSYWWGSINSWGDDTLDLKHVKHDLQKAFDEEYDLPIENIELVYGCRPVTKDRRPLIGKHSSLPNMYIFNGFGTKGASLTPYWADQLTRNIINGNTLPAEVCPNRFSTGIKK